MKSRLVSIPLALAAFSCALSASAITREEALVRARSYASHPWRATSANMTASCKAAYTSVYVPGDFVGVPTTGAATRRSSISIRRSSPATPPVRSRVTASSRARQGSIARASSDTCIYTSTTSFCSKPCAITSDCGDMPGGAGCCEDIGSGEHYCMTQSMCGSGGSTHADGGTPSSGGGTDGGTGGGTNADAGTPGDMGGADMPGNQADPSGTAGGGASTTNGCTFSPTGAQGAGPFLIGLLGIGVRIFRRRRTRRRWPHALML